MDAAAIRDHGDDLYIALRERHTVAPLTDRVSGISIDDAYRISQHMVGRRQDDGETVVGKKIGVTSAAVQNMLGVHQPDFGFLTDAMGFEDGCDMPISSQLIQPRAEGEIAFVLGKDLNGPGVTNRDVLAATDAVHACFEVVDSRIHDWKIKIEDTIADNASSGLFVLGKAAADPRSLDLTTCSMVVKKNNEVISTGAGAATLGSPLTAVAWLANTLGRRGIPLRAGDVILSGSLVPLEPVVAGDHMTASIAGMGSVSVHFV